MDSPSVTIFVASYNTAFATELCVRTIRKFTKYQNYSIVVGDSGSTDSTLSRLVKMCRTGIIDEIQLFPKGRSHADWLDYWTSICETKYAIFLDSDVEILKECWLEKLVSVAEAERCALVTSEILSQTYSTYRDFTGVTRRLHPRPAPWMLLIRPDVCKTMGSWKYFSLKDTTIKEGAWAYDTGALVYQNLLAESKIVRAMERSFKQFFRHYGGFSWVGKTKAKGFRGNLNKFRVRLLKFVVILKVTLIHFQSNI